MSEIERFYQLLPAIYRQHDAAAGEPLRAMLAVLERELRTIERDVEATYDNWFVQTCDTWVLPYLADLVGIRTMSHQRRILGTQRRQVANTIAYRRRKGALSVLEYALRDVTGWHVRAVELYQQIAATPHVAAHGRPPAASANLRDALALDHAGGPFNQIAHSADVRALSPAEGARAGRYNLGNLALFVWRLRAYTVREAQPYPLPAPHGSAFARFALHPTGRPMQLFNQPQLVGDIAGRLTARHLPLALHRAELAADLDEYARTYAATRAEDRAASSRFYGPDRGLQLALAWPGGGAEPLPPMAVACADLAALPDGALDRLRQHGKRAVIDPLSGHVALLDPSAAGATLRATYSYGFSAEIGGGPYHRRSQQPSIGDANVIAVARGSSVPTLREALVAWNSHCQSCLAHGAEPHGIIRLLDNTRHGDDGLGDLVVWLPLGANLTIAADNGVRPAIGPGCDLLVRFDGPGEQPSALSSIASLASQPDDAYTGDIRARRLLIDGLLIDGSLRVGQGRRARPAEGRIDLAIEHCTIVGGATLHLAEGRARIAQLAIRSSIVGPLRAPPTLLGVFASDSIIDGAPGREAKATAFASLSGDEGARVTLERVTVFGDVRALALSLRDSLVAGAAAAAGKPFVPASDSAIVDAGASAALFTSTRYGQPGYAQLRPASPVAHRRGATDGTQQGAFASLYTAQAEDNLAPVLEEYLPIGLEAGFFFVT
ncbi:phage tail protein [Kouleothrix sp.]|uniref:phage tail protein n=1 Tax=Kouleothrix sp. TaxID=2779161 RepID=UPI0039189D69